MTSEINALLIKAVLDGNLEKVKESIEQGADIHANNDEALQWASFVGYLDVVIYLVEHGANITPGALDWASENGHKDIVEYLAEQGSDRLEQLHEEIIKLTDSILTKQQIMINQLEQLND